MKKFILILLLSLTAISNSVLPRLAGSQKVAVGVLSGLAGVSAFQSSHWNWGWTLTRGHGEPRFGEKRDSGFWDAALNNFQHGANAGGVGVVTAASLLRLIRR
jgi:hypothetical protein